MLHTEVEADQLSSIRSIICIWKTDRVNFKLMSTSTKKSVEDRTTSVYDLLSQKTNSTRQTNLESTLCALLIYNLMVSVRIKGIILLFFFFYIYDNSMFYGRKYMCDPGPQNQS